MEDAIKVVSTKFKISVEVLSKVSEEHEPIATWMTLLGAYVLDNDRKQEEQKANENLLRKQRLNAEHQLSQLEKQLISCNGKLTKYEKNLLDVKTKFDRKEDYCFDLEKKYNLTQEENKLVKDEIAQLRQKYSHLEDEKVDFSEILEKNSKEIDRLTEEWNEISKRLADANKDRYQLQYELDEIKNSDIRKEFKEKRLEQEKTMLTQQISQFKKDLEEKTSLAIEFRKDNMGKVIDLETKNGLLTQENEQLKKILEISKKTCKEQEAKITDLLMKMNRAAEEHIEAENSMQQELASQTKLVELYKEDRDHAKHKLEEVMTAVSELQKLVKESSEEKMKLEARLRSESEEHNKKLEELSTTIKRQATELENANDLLQLSRKKGGSLVSDESISNISPMAAASSAILKKGMTLTQIYTEYVRVTDELTSEKDENSRLKLYMEQILQEVEEKAPLLMKQKEDYEHATNVIQNMSMKMEENIKECYRLKNEHGELDRNLNFHKREEKRLRTLCVDLSQQVRVLLKEVEEARGGVVSSTSDLPELMAAGDALNSSSAGAVISEHLVTFKSIEELQAQNERLLLTVRQLSEEQEKLEQEGGPEIIQELKKKIENAKVDLSTLQENQRTQEEMMQQLARQRDMYKVLCQKGGVMVGDISSTSNISSSQMEDVEGELSKTKAELNRTIGDHMRLKEEVASKEQKLQGTIAKQEEQISSLKLQCEQLKNQFKFSEEKYSILKTASEGYKNEAKALEEKCKSINEAYTKTRIEAEKYKQDYIDSKDKMVAAEVAAKSFETEKNLLKESEKRLMQENQSLLEQQRSQNILLTNLQTIQNNLERQEFETRKSLSKQVDGVQREMRALRRQSDNEGHQLRLSKTSMEKEVRELNVKLGIMEEKHKTASQELESAKQQIDTLEGKCKELEALNNASTKRLSSILEGDLAAKAQDDSQHELDRYKTRVRELEVELSSASNSKKAIEDQLEVMKKHLEQYKEIGDSNEQAINDLTKAKEAKEADLQKRLTEALTQVKNYKAQITAVVAEKLQLKKSNEAAERTLQAKIAEVKQQTAPLERRYQEVTRALINAKELETLAKQQSQEQSRIAREAQDKYERELVLHARDVEQLTKLKEESTKFRDQHEGSDAQLSEMTLNMNNNQKLMEQMRSHHQEELKKGEQVRKDLISQNGILHGQVEKLSAQLAEAKSQNRKSDGEQESSSDKTIEEVYELLRFVRREKEIAETKAEASETESMRYRQRAEHLQRDLEETKKALELELQRTKGLMLTEEEHKSVMEKVKKCKEFEVLIKELEKQKTVEMSKSKSSLEKSKKLEEEMKPLREIKKSLDNEKNTWLAEKTALKSEIERWTARTNQAVAQAAKTENEEVKKLQQIKTQNDKMISALQEDAKRTKQQLELFKRESLRLKNENSENQNKLNSLQTELIASQANKAPAAQSTAKTLSTTDVAQQQKEVDEMKKTLEIKTKDLNEKNKIVQQLKKLAKKYKTQSEKYQKLLTENKIDFASDLSGAPTASGEGEAANAQPQPPATAQMDPEEKKKLESQLQDRLNTINEITGKLASLQDLLEAEKKEHYQAKEKFETLQKQYIEAEKKLLEQRKETEHAKNELAEEKDKNEKKQKFFKTAKEKMASLTKQKDSSQQEVEILKKQVGELRASLEQSGTAGNNADQIEELNAQLEESKRLVEELSKEKNMLTAHIEQLRVDLDKAVEDKRNAENTLKAANQQKARAQSVGTSKLSSEATAGVEPISVAPLTATVRPTATTQASKFYPQSTPTASIRPIAHTAPTAMISPSVPATQSTTESTLVPVSVHVSIHPFTHGQQPPQMGEVQGRVRMQVQPQEVMAADQAPYDPQPSSSSSAEESSSRPNTKRQHVELEEPEESSTLEDTEASGEEPGNKRQKTETIESQELIASAETDSQEGNIEEDQLLAEAPEEEDDDDVMEALQPTQDYAAPSQLESGNGAREQRLQNERALIPSPQELMRQQRSQIRGRSQLPSFSLPSHAGAVYYDDAADDSTVPSTPTLYMPKRTDGFAEAVSSPVVRFPTFSFSTNDQPSSSQTPALGQSGELVQQTRMDLLGTDEPASVPQTPLSVVPSGTNQPSAFQPTAGFFSEDNGQEQNVPQQIDLTEDDEDDDNNVDDDVENEEDEEVENEGEADDVDNDDDNTELNYQLEEATEEEQDDGVEMFAPDNDDIDDREPVEEEEEVQEEEDEGEQADKEESNESEEDSESEESSVSEEDAGLVEEEERLQDTEAPNDGDNDEDIVEIQDEDGDYEEGDEEEEEEEVENDGDNDDDNGDDVEDNGDNVEESTSAEMPEEKETAETSPAPLEELDETSGQSDQSKSRPVRLQRPTGTSGLRPRLRRAHLQGRPAKPDSS